eukprot:scaffold696_cov197-Alexandrium_tamarense.AAC.15
MGDQNCDGDATLAPSNDLLDSTHTDTSATPNADRGEVQAPASYQNRRAKTASSGLRADYMLPWEVGLEILAAYL